MNRHAPAPATSTADVEHRPDPPHTSCPLGTRPLSGVRHDRDHHRPSHPPRTPQDRRSTSQPPLTESPDADSGGSAQALLVRWTSPSLFEALARRAGLAARILGRQTSPRRPRIRSVRTELTMSGACEATVLLEEGDRVRAAAARLELLRERWILTGLEMA